MNHQIPNGMQTGVDSYRMKIREFLLARGWIEVRNGKFRKESYEIYFLGMVERNMLTGGVCVAYTGGIDRMTTIPKYSTWTYYLEFDGDWMILPDMNSIRVRKNRFNATTLQTQNG